MTSEQDNQHNSNAPWYRQSVFWMLMAGPIIVVIAAIVTFIIARINADDMVSDDYYKDGKHINLQLERDVEAVKRDIQAQVLFNDDTTAAKVFISGDFDHSRPLDMILLHPAKKAYDQKVILKPATTPSSGDKMEYLATFNPLPPAVHWYIRIEDEDGIWRVEEKWQPSQSAAVSLKPKDNILVQGEAQAMP